MRLLTLPVFVFVTAAAVLPAGFANAVTFAVNSYLDEPDLNPGNGVCDSDSSPSVTRCTLRAAVMETNNLTGLDVIELGSGVHTLTRAGLGDSNGDLDVVDDLHVIGVAGTVIDAGGVRNNGDLSIVNSTLVGNSTHKSGGGVYSYGNLKIASSTIYANSCDLDADGTGTGCGVWLLTGASDVRNTVIAGNLNWSNSSPVTVPDDCDGAFTSFGHNLIGFPGAACTGFSLATNDFVGMPLLDAKLEGVADNGGFGPTCLPEPGSLTIDAGNPAGCPGDVDFNWSTPPTLLTTEQRGYPRALDDNGNGTAYCNIGAVEMTLFADGFESGDTGTWG